MRFKALDGWRGICALLVALFHLNVNWHGYSSPFIRNSYLFVDFFFALSGFVISSAYTASLDNTKDVKQFLTRRFGRVYPLHFFVLLSLIALECLKFIAVSKGAPADHPPFTGMTSFGAILTNILLVHSFGIHQYPTWNIPSWSIGAEFYTYIIFALVTAYIRPINKRLANFTLVVFALIGFAIVIRFSPNGQDTTFNYGFFRCLSGFLCGVATFSIYRRNFKIRQPLINAAELAILILTVLYVIKASRETLSFIAPLIFSMTILIFAGQQGWVSKLLMTPYIQNIGKWSYSIYMTHLLIIYNVIDRPVRLIEQFFNFKWSSTNITTGPSELGSKVKTVIIMGNQYQSDALTFFYIIIVLYISSMTYRYIENPCRDYFRH